MSMIPNVRSSLEVAAAELQLCFVIEGKVWLLRTFLPMVTIVVLPYEAIQAIYTTCYCVVRQKRF